MAEEHSFVRILPISNLHNLAEKTLTFSEGANAKINLSDIGLSPPWNPAVVILPPGRLFSDPEDLFVALKKSVGISDDQHGALLIKNRNFKTFNIPTKLLCTDIIAILLDPFAQLSVSSISAAVHDALSCSLYWKLDSPVLIKEIVSRSEFKVIVLDDEVLFAGDLIECLLNGSSSDQEYFSTDRSEPETFDTDKSICKNSSPFLRSLRDSRFWISEIFSMSEMAPILYSHFISRQQ